MVTKLSHYERVSRAARGLLGPFSSLVVVDATILPQLGGCAFGYSPLFVYMSTVAIWGLDLLFAGLIVAVLLAIANR